MLAGFVDALAFIYLGGFFVSFMSGNSTRLGVALVDGSADAFLAAGLIPLFVLGAASGSVIGHFAKTRRRFTVLGFVTLCLFIAAGLSGVGLMHYAVVAMVIAMGAENTVFEREGEVSIGLTYMTGSLVKLGQKLAQAILGGPRLSWLPYFLLWSGLVSGVALGAASYTRFGLGSLWLAAFAGLLLTLVVTLLDRDQRNI
tara:strand:- start:31054 stop:31653 length:600 start_codon:yes stop_codon:yes gene_type:complete